MTKTRDAAIGELAGQQGGYVTRAQLLAAGLSAQNVKYRVRIGRLIAVHRGVYAVGHLPRRPLDLALGALLACGGRSVLSHGSAASAWEISRSWRFPLEVTLALNRRPSGLIVHHSKTLVSRDVSLVAGVRTTSAARTLLDIAPRTVAGRLTRAFNDLRLRGALSVGAVDDVVARNPRHPGARLLRPLVADSQTEPTRSALEDAFIALVRDHGLPQPAVNVRVAGYRVDALFGDDALIVELDGWATHRTRAAFARDRRQDAEILSVRGIPTVRLTHFETTREAASTAERLRSILRTRGVAVSPGPAGPG